MDFYNFSFFLLIIFLIFLKFSYLKISLGQSVDHFYWLLCVKNFKKKKKLPIFIKNKYLLEYNKQHYPPGFAIFLSFFSFNFLKSSKSSIIPSLIDILILIIILLFFHNFTDLTFNLYIICIFLSFPIFLLYNTQLTSRCLGNLFYICSVLPIIIYIEQKEFFLFILLLSSVFYALMYLTHKMTTQYYTTFLILLLFFDFELDIKILVFGTILLGLIFSVILTGFHFFKFQLAHHAEIILFWYRNWKNLQAHSLLDSKYYTKKILGFKSSQLKFHKGGIKGCFFYLRLLISYMPHIFLAPLFLYEFYIPLWLEIWIIFSILISTLTLFVPIFRCVGAGHLYLYNAALPMILLFEFIYDSQIFTETIAFIGLICIPILLVGLYKRDQNNEEEINKYENQLINFLNNCKSSNIGIFPMNKAEKIAFYTRHKILWGGHGYGLKKLEPVYPVCKFTIPNLMSNYKLKYLSINIIWLQNIYDYIKSEKKLKIVYQNKQWVVLSLL